MPRMTSVGATDSLRAVKAQCKFCHKHTRDLRKHLSKHIIIQADGVYHCPYKCGARGASQRSAINIHMAIHTGIKHLNCPNPDCKYASGDPAAMLKHRKRLHGYIPAPRRTRRNPIPPRYPSWPSPYVFNTGSSPASTTSPLDSSEPFELEIPAEFLPQASGGAAQLSSYVTSLHEVRVDVQPQSEYFPNNMGDIHATQPATTTGSYETYSQAMMTPQDQHDFAFTTHPDLYYQEQYNYYPAQPAPAASETQQCNLEYQQELDVQTQHEETSYYPGDWTVGAGAFYTAPSTQAYDVPPEFSLPEGIIEQGYYFW